MAETVSLPFDAWTSALDSGEFEEAFAALEQIVQSLEQGGLKLADAVRCFEIGNQLTRKCNQMLVEAELRITQLDEVAGIDSAREPGQLFPTSAPE